MGKVKKEEEEETEERTRTRMQDLQGSCLNIVRLQTEEAKNFYQRPSHQSAKA